MNNTNITGEELDVNEIKFEKFKAEAKKKINDNKLFKLGVCTFVITGSAFVLHFVGALISSPVVVISALGILASNIFLAPSTFKALDEVEKNEKIISNCDQLLESRKKIEQMQKLESMTNNTKNDCSMIKGKETKEFKSNKR